MIDSISPSTSTSAHASDADAAIELAKLLLSEAKALQTPAERRQQSELDRMIGNDADKATLIEMTDQAFRTHTPARVADQMTHLLDVQGIPRFFSPIEQAMLRGFQAFGEYLPGVSVPLVKEQMRRETANVILPAERDLLSQHLTKRQQNGVSMNLNLLGEALVGEEETRERMEAYTEVLRMPEVRCLSVKLTTLYSHVSGLARKQTVSVASDRLERLYRVANRQIDPVTGRGKFVYLDMEEYRDLHLTADVLRETLSRDGLDQTAAGIALQAYVPDSYGVMQDLIDWSRRRVEAGGRELTIRLVKGANMEMERVDASVGGFELAPYGTKIETDANYKRMLWGLLNAAKQSHVRVGIASHNLFDIALAMIWTEQLGCQDAVQFEMLEGMANHQRRALTERDAAMLLYAPACRKSDFLHSIGYLIRRLDENTGRENFLRYSYRLAPGMPEFDELASSFSQSLDLMATVSDQPRRTQDRRQTPQRPPVADHWRAFVNEPDTDWSLPHHSPWIEEVLQQWQTRLDDNATRITPVVAGDLTKTESNHWHESHDVSSPGRVSCRYQLASADTAETAVAAAFDTKVWDDTSLADRHAVLRDVAQLLRERRGDLIGGMAADAGKTVGQSDPEISEAIDFCEFYPLSLRYWEDRPGTRITPRGVVAVITPWNFPLAIPCGGIAAALSVGNPVILKPARETLLPAWQLCQAFWDAGVPKEMLQFLPCEDSVAETYLVKDPRIDTVILTGGTSTAKRMLSVRPDLHLMAETGGKNATIVSSLSDRDLAIKHVVYSAFGHGGQKCSATSLLLLEDEVFNDNEFRERLADAVKSLHAGSAWDLSTDVPPLVCPPNEELTRGLKELDDTESWLVTPEHVNGCPTLYRPGVKWNVQPGSFSHRTELFGPVLSVMRYSRLEEAIGIVQSTGYGLTSGLESLDEREIELWKETISAGNLYVNRPTTGAIVLRQPFGGVGMSAYGPGVKAGGPHYVLALSHLEEQNVNSIETATGPDLPTHPSLDRFSNWLDQADAIAFLDSTQVDRIKTAIQSQRRAVAEELGGQHDTFGLLGQDNIRRYRCVDSMVVRIHQSDLVDDWIIAAVAAIAVGTPITLSMSTDVAKATELAVESLADWLPGMIHPIQEPPAGLADRVSQGQVDRVRCFSPMDADLLATCNEAFVTVIREPVLADGSIECLRYLNEQSISHDYHRYGNLGRRASHEVATTL